MGTIISKIEEIENICWTKPKKGRVYAANRIMFIDETTAIVELKNGSYTIAGRRHSPNGNWAVVGYGLDHFTHTVLNGLVKLGILDRKQVREHIATAQDRQKERERKFTIRRLNELCDELGIKAPVVE